MGYHAFMNWSVWVKSKEKDIGRPKQCSGTAINFHPNAAEFGPGADWKYSK